MNISDLEICKITARMCGEHIEHITDKQVIILECDENGETSVVWNPLTNAEQAMECLEELHKRYTTIVFEETSVQVDDDGLLVVRVSYIGANVSALIAQALAEIGKGETT